MGSPEAGKMNSQITAGMLVDVFGQEAGQVLRVQHRDCGGGFCGGGVGGAEDLVDGGDVVGGFVEGGRCVVIRRVGAIGVWAAFVTVAVELGLLLVDVEVLGRCVWVSACERHCIVSPVLLERWVVKVENRGLEVEQLVVRLELGCPYLVPLCDCLNAVVRSEQLKQLDLGKS